MGLLAWLTSCRAKGAHVAPHLAGRDGTEDGTYHATRRPRCSGEHTEHLKHEDTTASLEVELPHTGAILSLICVADGHGGPEASSWLRDHVLPLITSRAGDGSSDALQRACVAAFKEADAAAKALAADCAAVDMFSSGECGSTLTVVILNHKTREVTCANVGDSEALLVHRDGHEALCTSHRLDDNEDECARVKELGHKLAQAADSEGRPGGPMRAWPGGLAVTRGIGDGDCPYSICLPALKTVQVPASGGVLVVCSDGVWDSLPLTVIADFMRNPPHQWASPRQAARSIAKRARAKSGLFDDISAVTLFFDSADPREHDSFLCQHFKSPLVYRRCFLYGSSSPNVSMLDMDSSKHAGEEFVESDVDDSKHSGSLFSAFSEVLSEPEESPRSTRPFSLRPREEGDANQMNPRNSSELKVDFAPPGELTIESDGAWSAPSAASGPKPARVRRLSHDNEQELRIAASPEKQDALSDAMLADLGEQTYDNISDGMDETLLAAAEKSFKRRAVSPSISVSGSVLSSHGSFNRNRERAQTPTSLAPAEMHLWKGAALARMIPWDSLLSAQMYEVGQGEFATAWATELDGTGVVVKVLKPHKRHVPTAVKGIKREIMLMSMISHPHVLPVRAMGYFNEDGVPFLVLERLCTILSKELPGDPDSQPFWVTWRQRKAWSLTRALEYGIQLAKALRFCHDEAVEGYRILHRDIKPNNIGFMHPSKEEAESGAKLGRLVIFDFGLTCIWAKDEHCSVETSEWEEMRSLTGECGSLRYMAPEVATSRPYNHLSEVFSFSTVLWEMAAKRRPFNNFTADTFRQALSNGARPELQAKWPGELKQLFEDMWQHDPTRRPGFSQIVPRLESLYASEQLQTRQKKRGRH